LPPPQACGGHFWIAASWLLAATATLAEPSWKSELTPPGPGDFAPLAPCVVDLQVSWKGLLDSGTVRMEFAPKEMRKPGSLVVRSASTSLGTAAVLFPYASHTWSEIDLVSLHPKFFQSTETDGKETVVTTNRHFPDRVESTEVTTPRHQKPLAKRRQHEFAASPIFDAYSAMLHIRSQKLAPGDRITLLIHPFHNPYLLRVKVVAREIHLDRKTIRLSVGMRKIDRKTLELRPYRKMKRDATLWLSDDAERIPVELRAAIFIGDIRATLSDFRKS
jgi:hypothetical protein